MQCSNCGAEIASNSKFCPSCGITIDSNVSSNNNNSNSSQNSGGYRNPNPNLRNSYTTMPGTSKSPILALILSLFIVGLGQLYLGQVGKGILMFALAAFFGLFSFGLLWFGVAIWSAVDAYQTAKKI